MTVSPSYPGRCRNAVKTNEIFCRECPLLDADKKLREPLSLNPSFRPFRNSLKIEHASLYNLKGVSVSISVGVITAVFGVAGSGKSSLVCRGKGEVTPDVAFANLVAILCEECGGHRYNETALSYIFQGKNIEEVMGMTVDQALQPGL